MRKKQSPFVCLILAFCTQAASSATQILAPFTPILDGTIDSGSTHVKENPAAGPVTGGSTTNSDFIGESSANHWIDSSSGTTYNIGSNRGDIQQFYVSADLNNLYLSLTGPQLAHNSWTGPGGGSPQTNGDVGDIWIAIDIANTPSGNLSANSTRQFSSEGVRAVDFTGWSPTHFVGVQYVDNGGGGGGYAGFGSATAGNFTVGEGHGLGNGGFDWATTGNGYEFAIPWSDLGLSSETLFNSGRSLRFGAYTTQNFGGSDVYDQGPGLGNGGPFEQIGDFVGDTDTGLPGTDTDGDGPISGTQPGANWVDPSGYTGPSNGDQYDTIGEYWEITFIPEPSSALLIFLGLTGMVLRRRR